MKMKWILPIKAILLCLITSAVAEARGGLNPITPLTINSPRTIPYIAEGLRDTRISKKYGTDHVRIDTSINSEKQKKL